MTKKKDIDIFGIILGVIIGCLLGYFLSTKVGATGELTGENQTKDVYGNVYLLQINSFDNFDAASSLVSTLEAKGLYSIIVNESSTYYVYGDIGLTSDDLEDKKSLFESKGYTPIEKKDYILDLPNRALDNEYEFDFWEEGIKALLANLDNNRIDLDDQFYLDIVDIEFLTSITILNDLENEEFIHKARLQAYQILIDKLK